MGKSLTIVQTTWQRSLTHRFSIVAYRIGEIIELLFLIIMWTALYKNTSAISGYTLSEMITYILIGNLIATITRNFMTEFVAREIHEGALSLFLVKPISYFRYAFIREIGRVTLPTAFSILTNLFVIIFFADRIVINTNINVLLILGTMTACAFVTELFLSFIIGLVAFWANEVDGIYTTVNRLKKFVSGGYFPISLLPLAYVKISYALPFAYSFFVPTQLYLGKISPVEALHGVGIQILWIIALYIIIKLVWKRGLKKYEGVGI